MHVEFRSQCDSAGRRARCRRAWSRIAGLVRAVVARCPRLSSPGFFFGFEQVEFFRCLWVSWADCLGLITKLRIMIKTITDQKSDFGDVKWLYACHRRGWWRRLTAR